MRFTRFRTALAWLLFFAPLAAQSPIVINGRVLAGDPESPVAGAIIAAGTATTRADQDGRFTLSVSVAEGDAGTVRLKASAPGYVDTTVDVPVGNPSITIVLRPVPRVNEDVEVSATISEAVPTPPTLEITPASVRSVAGSADNVFRVLQTMPGVSATNDIDSRLSVRGGGPDQNLTVMDGVEIHNPYRLFGLTSAFNPETIDRFELTAGGFGPQYGDRLSSILVIDNRRGIQSQAFAGSAALSITDANVVLEGRLPGRSTGSWLLTGRRTYYDVFAERITDNDLPSFGDVQTKVSWSPGHGRELTLFGLRSRERTDAVFGAGGANRFALDDAASNDVVSVTFFSPISRTVTSKTIASWYRYADALDVDGSVENEGLRSNAPGNDAFGRSAIVFRRDIGLRDLALRQNLTAVVGRSHTLDIGVETHTLDTRWGWRIAGDRNTSEANGSSALGGTGLPGELDSAAPSSRIGAWIDDAFRLGPRVHLGAGLRVDWSELASDAPISPRVRALIDLTPRTHLKLAAGLYTQSPGYEKLLQSDYFFDLSSASELGLRNERSWHAVGGLERQIGRAVTARVETYYKTFDRLLVGRLETPEETAARTAQYAFPAELAENVPTAPEIIAVPANGASGRLYGFDVYLEHRPSSTYDRVTGWVSYTWGRAAINNYGREYAFDYDRRHSLSLVSTIRLSSRIDLGTTLRVASGFPETTPVGLRVAAARDENVPEGAPGSLVPSRDPSGLLVWTIDYGGTGNLNGARLPVYARLDARLTYSRSRASRWQFYVEVLNLFNRENAGALTPSLHYSVTSDRPTLTTNREEGLPTLPSFGIRAKF